MAQTKVVDLANAATYVRKPKLSRTNKLIQCLLKSSASTKRLQTGGGVDIKNFFGG